MNTGGLLCGRYLSSVFDDCISNDRGHVKRKGHLEEVVDDK